MIFQENKKNLIKVINSIHKLNIPNYEIIIVGNIFIESNKTIIINFDENIKKSFKQIIYLFKTFLNSFFSSLFSFSLMKKKQQML